MQTCDSLLIMMVRSIVKSPEKKVFGKDWCPQVGYGFAAWPFSIAKGHVVVIVVVIVAAMNVANRFYVCVCLWACLVIGYRRREDKKGNTRLSCRLVCHLLFLPHFEQRHGNAEKQFLIVTSVLQQLRKNKSKCVHDFAPHIIILSPWHPLFFDTKPMGTLRIKRNKLIASRTFPAPQAAGMSAYNVCVREIIKKTPNIQPKSEASRVSVKFWGQFLSDDKPANQKGVYSFYDPPPPPPHFIIAENCSFPDWNSRVGFFPMPMPIIAPVILAHLQLF